ncbi:hypothetical protein D3C72_2367200 [compost metagenome]|nr:hypothetical protein REQ54_04541 [Rhizobium sp. Q54]
MPVNKRGFICSVGQHDIEAIFCIQDKAAPSIALNKAEDAGGSAIHFNGALGDCEFDG